MSAVHVATMLEMEIPENPFPGLRPFEFNESLLYFGRDGQSEQLLRKLSATRFLAVVGTSGSGKSSLVRAGLLPALLGGFMSNAGSNWQIALMRPGFDPIGNLARALAAPDVLGTGGDQDVLSAMAESTLRRGNFGLMDLAKQARIGPRQNLLIVADQFEELFRVAGFAESEAYRNRAAAFVKLLLEASRQRELPIYVVLTMRSDFLGDCSSFWGLPEAINEGQYLIPRLTREQRREAITGPIAVCGGSITDRLVTRLLNDIGDDQDQLPLLQHALMRTWVKWNAEGAGREAIDLEDYESIGGMCDALSMHVDEAFNSLPDERSRQVAEKIFKGLTEKGSDNREIRRPVTLAGLSVLTGAGESELAPVIDTFRQQARSFLMPPAEVQLTSTAMIDISHESLIRKWRRLKEWVDEEARSARIYRRLAETAALYREEKAGLARDPELQVALKWRELAGPTKEWAERYHQDFDQAMDFLDKSLAERGAEQLAREAERRDREIRRCRQVRNARVTTVAVAMALMVSLGTLVYANRQKQVAILRSEEASVALEKARASEILAQEEKTKAEEEKTRAEASAILAEKNGRVALDQKARADQQTKYSKQVAKKAMLAEERTRHLLYAADLNLAQHTHDDEKDVARGDELLTTQAKESRGFEWYYLWNRYHTAAHTIKGFERSLTSVSFSPTNKNLLATGSADGTLALIDSVSGKTESLNTKASSIWGSVFSPDGKQLAVLGDSNTLELWDVESKQRLGILPSKPTDPEIECIAFWQEAKLAAGNEDGSITVWDLKAPYDHPHNKQTLQYPNSRENAIPDVGALAGSPEGNILVSGYENGVLRIWNLASGKPVEAALHRSLSVHNKITDLAISSDGKFLASTTEEGWLAIWVTSDVFRQEDFRNGEKQGKPLFEKKLLSEGLNCLAFSEDGKELATAGADGVVAFWDMRALRATRSKLDALEQAKRSAKTDSELTSLDEQIQALETAARGSIKPGRSTLPLEHSGPITCIAFSGNGHTFASGSSDKTVKVWHLSNGRNQEKGAISPDGYTVATVVPDSIKVLEGGQVRRTFALDPKRKVLSMVFSPDSKAIIAGLEGGAVKIYHPKTGNEIELSKGKQEISSDARFVANWNGDVVGIWDTSRGEVSHEFLPRTGFKIQSHRFSPDSKAVAVSYSDGVTKLYYLETGKEFEIVKLGGGGQAVAFCQDGKFLALTPSGGCPDLRTEAQSTLKIWNVKERRLATKEELNSANKLMQPEPILTVRSPAGSKIASAQDDSITLSDSDTQPPITRAKAHLIRVTALAFSSDGETLASGGLDGTVKLWSTKSLEFLSDIPALKKTDGTLNPIVSLAFSGDGKRLAMGTNSDGGTLVIWDLLAHQELLRGLKTPLPKSSTFSADNLALGSHTLERIWLGGLETDRVTIVSHQAPGQGALSSWMSSRDEVAIPDNALTAGYSSKEDVFLHICRLRYKNNWYVGYTWGGDCHIGDVGPELGQYTFGIYEVLLNNSSTSWLVNTEDSKDRSSKATSLIAGERGDGKVAVCRVTNQSGTYIGWTVDNECHVWKSSRTSGQVPDGFKFEILHEIGVKSPTTASSRRRSH